VAEEKGRVMLVQIETNCRTMAQPKDDKDAELCRKVNWLLNNPPVPGASGDPFAGMSMVCLAPSFSGHRMPGVKQPCRSRSSSPTPPK
jgi:hypothetical protein